MVFGAEIIGASRSDIPSFYIYVTNATLSGTGMLFPAQNGTQRNDTFFTSGVVGTNSSTSNSTGTNDTTTAAWQLHPVEQYQAGIFALFATTIFGIGLGAYSQFQVSSGGTDCRC